jgi:D-psicose/D-tagatose/L-ribulose 3-epimerase
MNQIGVHQMLFTAGWNEDLARKVFERAAKIGYDLVEILVGNPFQIDAAMTARVAREHRLGAVMTLCGTPTADISSADPAIARAGEEWVAQGIAAARDMGSPLLGGPTYGPVVRNTLRPSEYARARAVEIYQRLAARATASGIRLALEVLNRYEGNFINTVGQAADLCRKVGSDAMSVHADLFHMSIEEGDLSRALEGVKDVLGYVHVAESNRGCMGDGNTDWKAVFGTLARIGYRGPITFESFSPQVLGPEFAGFIALWRDPWTDPDDVATRSLAFIRKHLQAQA